MMKSSSGVAKLKFKEETMKLNGLKVKVSVPLGRAEFKDLRSFFDKMVKESKKSGIKKNPFQISP